MKRIILIGYMGSGKTTVGKALAKELGLPFYDLDWYIENRMRKKVSQIFGERGEEGFRQIERNMLHEVAEFEDVVVSCGGGTPCFFDNMDYLNRQADVVWLKATPEVLQNHLLMGKGDRPLLKGKTPDEMLTFIREQLKVREPYYEKARYHLDVSLMDNFDKIKVTIGKLRQLLNLNIAAVVMLLMMVTATAEARQWTGQQVVDVICRVNNYWQSNNPAEVRSFWDNAAYHTGNMEVCKLLTERDERRQDREQMMEYSVRWAEHNNWQGATETDPAKWKYKQYGEGQDYVLFGDWQICFQTYIDLFLFENGTTNYKLQTPNTKLRRAIEVMGYEADSKANDYWWWADALYMVMPVMTKMYRLTGERKYLDKLYLNLLYSDSIMLDTETGLYFRDGKYVWPKHKSANGKKDFWARGDGWVLAGLAKVLQDMPGDYVRQPWFVDKYTRLARAVAALQQKEGYWTRSMADPDHAPGPETSGTAFFTYGLLWGVNNGFLQKKEFQTVIDSAWRYLTETALQPSGKVGYVQPIGERAIPGQTVDQNSEANFGVGAFLLAACEYARYLRS